jgi:hypothetical protein
VKRRVDFFFKKKKKEVEFNDFTADDTSKFLKKKKEIEKSKSQIQTLQ